MYLLDTNVISEARKIRSGKSDPSVEKWFDDVTSTDMYISVISVHELELGILAKERQDKAQGEILRQWFENRVLPTFQDRTLVLTQDAAIISARLHVPNPQPVKDAYIAGIAVANRLIVVTRNTKDFEGMNVKTLNPWHYNSA